MGLPNKYDSMSNSELADIMRGHTLLGVRGVPNPDAELITKAVVDRLERTASSSSERGGYQERFQHPGYRMDESVRCNYQFHVNPIVNQPYAGTHTPVENLRQFLINQGQVNQLITPLIVEKVMNAPVIRDPREFAAMLYSMDIFIEVNHKGEVEISFRGRSNPMTFMGGLNMNMGGSLNPGGFGAYHQPMGSAFGNNTRHRMPVLDFRVNKEDVDKEISIMDHMLKYLKEREAIEDPMMKWPEAAGTPENIVARIKTELLKTRFITDDADIEGFLVGMMNNSQLYIRVYDAEGEVDIGPVTMGGYTPGHCW